MAGVTAAEAADNRWNANAAVAVPKGRRARLSVRSSPGNSGAAAADTNGRSVSNKDSSGAGFKGRNALSISSASRCVSKMMPSASSG